MKKPIFKRWWFWVLVIIIGIGAINSTNKDKDDSTQVAADKNVKKSDPKKTAEPELSNEGVSSDVKIVVDGAESKSEVGDNQFSKKKAQGVFKVITITLTNNQKDAITIDSNSFKLVDDKGREFSYSSEGQTALMTSVSGKDESFFLKKLNPGLSITGKVVFDVPQDATGFYLKARGGMTGKEIKLKVD